MKVRALKIFSRLIRIARVYAQDPEKMNQLLSKASRLATKSGLKEARDDIRILGSLVRDCFTHRYNDYELKNLLVVVAGLIYLVTPVDALPDFIPVGGWVDDVFIISWVVDCVSDELTRYKNKRLHK